MTEQDPRLFRRELSARWTAENLEVTFHVDGATVGVQFRESGRAENCRRCAAALCAAMEKLTQLAVLYQADVLEKR